MNRKPMNYEELNKLFRYCPETGDIFNRIDRGGSRGTPAKAGKIATCKTSAGYLIVQFSKDGHRSCYMAHRVAWTLHYGVDPGDNDIDHIDGQRARNVISNLRLVDHQENSMNRRKSKNNTSGVTGVCWHNKTGKWQAYISDHGKVKSLGHFDDKFEAIYARRSAEKKIGYHKNHSS